MSRPGLVLFTRDLRVDDNPALARAAARHERIIPVFVFDERLLAGPAGSPRRVRFLLESLEDLDGSLRERGTKLVLRRGDPAGEALRLAGEHDVESIYLADDYTPVARRRLIDLERGGAALRVGIERCPGVTIVAPGAVAPAGADHYRVFSPYHRAWDAAPRRALCDAPTRLAGVQAVEAGQLAQLSANLHDELPGYASGRGSELRAHGGERQARQLLADWAAGAVAGYGTVRDELARDGTSHLSAHLHFGTVSAARVANSVGNGEGADSFVRQLCWRDFYHQLLDAVPLIVRDDYRPRGDDWSRDRTALAAWAAGLTGYPVVDAGMRQLLNEGYMHNRARLIVGSFLTKHLYIDWREGASHFARLLIDADVACNIGNWQWIAGTGTDTRPNRILNPLRQAQKLDPNGDYVRRHVPELAGLPGALAHTPWKLPVSARPREYPPPIVELDGALTRLRERRGAA